MYRSGWARKEGQERVLAIDITRTGFEWALAHSCLTAFDPELHTSPEEWQAQLQSRQVRVQWDPERDLLLEPLDWRTIQVGLRGQAMHAYVDSWIARIEDVTDLARRIELLVKSGDIATAAFLLPKEVPYPLPQDVARRVGCSARAIGELINSPKNSS